MRRILAEDGQCAGYRVRLLDRISQKRLLAMAIVAGCLAIGAGWFSIASVEAGRLRPTSEPAELSQRAGLKLAVHTLYDTGDFAGLGRMAEDFRRTGERTSSGVWKLSVFYSALYELSDGLGRHDGKGWQQLFGRLDTWREAFPSQPAAYVAEGIALQAYAGVMRPRQIVREASAGSDESFAIALRKARDWMDTNKAIASADPQFYVVRADIARAMGEEPDQFMALVNEGLDKSPGYYQLYFAGFDYFAVAGEGNGDAQAARMEAFANSAVLRSKQSEGDALYARLYWHAFTGFYGNDLFRKTRADWSKMRSGMKDVVAHYPDAWNVNHFAYLSCLAGDRDTTRQVIASMGEPPVLKVWQARAVFEGCRKWASAAPVVANRR